MDIGIDMLHKRLVDYKLQVIEQRISLLFIYNIKTSTINLNVIFLLIMNAQKRHISTC